MLLGEIVVGTTTTNDLITMAARLGIAIVIAIAMNLKMQMGDDE